MRRIAYLFILVVITCLPDITLAEMFSPSQYTSDTGHYSFNVPYGWRPIPGITLNDLAKSIAQTNNTQEQQFKTGFQDQNRDIIAPPYFIVKEEYVNTPSYKEIKELLNEKNTDKIIDSTLSKYSETIAGADIGKPLLDKKKNLVVIQGSITSSNGEKYTVISSIFLGKEAITQLVFYSKYEDNTQWQQTFLNVIDSFEYDHGYKYNPITVNSHEQGTFNGLWTILIGAGIPALFIVIVLHLFPSIKQKLSARQNNT